MCVLYILYTFAFIVWRSTAAQIALGHTVDHQLRVDATVLLNDTFSTVKREAKQQILQGCNINSETTASIVRALATCGGRTPKQAPTGAKPLAAAAVWCDYSCSRH